MGPIKFRGYDTDDKVMRSWKEIDFIKDAGDDYYMVGYKTSPISVKYDHKQILMQYTGLKDKNGTEIFEGDILTLKYPRDRRYTVTAKVIKGSQVSAMTLKFEDESTTEEIPLYKISANHNLEVIGNIYEHKHLIKE